MKVLIGTTNPSKVGRFKNLLEGYDVDFVTLEDIGIHTEPEEKGATPEENAAIKAKYYGQFFDIVICNDSGLYFEGLPLEDARQPGLNIRTPAGNKRLNDEEMIAYYSRLVHSLGGKVLAFYLDGFAVYNQGMVTSMMENNEQLRRSSFYMVDTPSANRHEGWPLDSISINKSTLTYFVEQENSKGERKEENEEEQIISGEYWKRVVSFLCKSLGLEERIES